MATCSRSAAAARPSCTPRCCAGRSRRPTSRSTSPTGTGSRCAALAPQRAALRRAPGARQGGDTREVRRRAVHAVAPQLRHPAAADRGRSEFDQSGDPRYAGIDVPLTECLKDVIPRMMPYWEGEIRTTSPPGTPCSSSPTATPARRSSSTSTASATTTSPALNIPTGSRSSTGSATTSCRRAGRVPRPRGRAAAAAAVANQGR